MENTKIRLEPVTVHDWKSCVALTLSPDQEGFVPSNLYSIAESQFYPDARSNAIYNEQNKLIGYALWGRDIFANKWKVFRIMIDKLHQRKGYGKSTMRAIIEQISTEPNGAEILISYQNDNEIARTLYAKLGFVEQEIDPKGKVTALFRQNIV